MSTFELPDLGEGLQEAEIVTWHVAEGDHVTADQPLVSVETDKAVVEIPAPFSGILTRRLAAEGDVVPIGAPLAEIDTGPAADTGAIVGELGDEGGVAPKAGPGGGAAAPSRPAPRAAEESGGAVRASPAARRLAREKGVDLARITGTGPHGTIQTSDVLAAAEAAKPAGAADELREGEALRGPRRSMARAMERAQASVVPATVMDSVEIGAWAAAENPTLRLIRAIAFACRQEPALNVWFDGERRIAHDHVDLALAVDDPAGLFTPVLRGVDSRNVTAEEVAALREAVRKRTLKPEDLKGATFTLSNFGMIAGRHAVLVVSPPQVAILGAGRIAPQCVVVDGRPEVRPVLPLSLSFDHRAVTGGEAARFLAALCQDLARPSAPELEDIHE
ncbi:MAG: 2-oxo acid dehydrogenase subunit E2 [Alphaproteobacteria bacterium]|nr:MAG: 2-oxo acid dehydrogenase subunit E2 [Alphaproteobacteria bacterium]